MDIHSESDWMTVLIWGPALVMMTAVYMLVAVLFSPFLLTYAVIYAAFPTHRTQATEWAITVFVLIAAVLTLAAWSHGIFTSVT